MSDQEQDLLAVAHDLIQNALANIDRDFDVPSDDVMEKEIDFYCKRHGWNTPKRHDLYQEIAMQKSQRLGKDRTIDIDLCASEIFNNMDKFYYIQDDAVDYAVKEYLDEKEYSRKHLNDVLHRVIKYIEQAISVTYYPNKENQR